MGRVGTKKMLISFYSYLFTSWAREGPSGSSPKSTQKSLFSCIPPFSVSQSMMNIIEPWQVRISLYSPKTKLKHHRSYHKMKIWTFWCQKLMLCFCGPNSSWPIKKFYPVSILRDMIITLNNWGTYWRNRRSQNIGIAKTTLTPPPPPPQFWHISGFDLKKCVIAIRDNWRQSA